MTTSSHIDAVGARASAVACDGEVEWAPASGNGTVYTRTVVHLKAVEHLDPPYAVVVVELAEGPRMLGNVAGHCAIGDRVGVAWRDREGAPPVPVWERA